MAGENNVPLQTTGTLRPSLLATEKYLDFVPYMLKVMIIDNIY